MLLHVSDWTPEDGDVELCYYEHSGHDGPCVPARVKMGNLPYEREEGCEQEHREAMPLWQKVIEWFTKRITR